MIARFICWLGLHSVIVMKEAETKSSARVDPAFGICTRCGRRFTWEVRGE